LSIEPIHGPINIDAWRPRWIIVGAETGNRKGRVIPDVDWLWQIYEYAKDRDIPLFFKNSLRSLYLKGSYFPQEYPA